jgi:hypothetical protein
VVAGERAIKIFQKTKCYRIHLRKAIEHEDGVISWSTKASEDDRVFGLLRRHRHSPCRTTTGRSNPPSPYNRRNGNAVHRRHDVSSDNRIDHTTTRAELLLDGIMNLDVTMTGIGRVRAVTETATQDTELTRVDIALPVTVDAKRDD